MNAVMIEPVDIIAKLNIELFFCLKMRLVREFRFEDFESSLSNCVFIRTALPTE
jgi:hypothetical protein